MRIKSDEAVLLADEAVNWWINGLASTMRLFRLHQRHYRQRWVGQVETEDHSPTCDQSPAVVRRRRPRQDSKL